MFLLFSSQAGMDFFYPNVKNGEPCYTKITSQAESKFLECLLNQGDTNFLWVVGKPITSYISKEFLVRHSHAKNKLSAYFRGEFLVSSTDKL